MDFEDSPAQARLRSETADAEFVAVGGKADVNRTSRQGRSCLAVLLLLSYIFAVVAAWAVEEDTGVGPPPALAVGQAPPLPNPGPLAEPLPSNDAAKRDD
jgi:hypothetical protein